MKKIICALLITAMLSMSACTAGSGTAAGRSTEDTESAAQADTQEFIFTKDNFPVIDGSTSIKPMAAAVGSVLLGISRDEADELIEFHKTTQSYRNLMNGECDIILASEPSGSVFEEMDAAGFEYEIEEIATDALIFVVNAGNPVDNLSTEQIRKIYTGEISNWNEVGGNDEEIVPFQRNEGAGSQALMLKLVMGDTPMMTAPKGYVASEMGELMEAVRSYDNSSAAIGYSVYYYANDMKKAEGLKIISVDGVKPDADTIRSGEYPHLNAYYCAIPAAAAEGSPARVLYDWMVSAEGQKLIEAEGYASVDPLSSIYVNVKTDYSKYSADEITNIYSRIDEDAVTDLEARDDYGMLYPFAGSPMLTEYDGQTHISGFRYGLFDAKGRIAVDAVYSSISALSRYDYENNTADKTGFWVLQKADGEVIHDDLYSYDMVNDDSLYAFCSYDGKVVSECIYKGINCNEGGIVAIEADGGFAIFDFEGNQLLTDESIGITDMYETYSAYSIEYRDGNFYIQLKDGMYYGFNSEGIIASPAIDRDTFYGVSDYTYTEESENGEYSDWYRCGNTDKYVKEEDDGIWIADAESGKEIFLEGMAYANPFYSVNMGWTADLPYIQVSNYDPESGESNVVLLSDELEIVETFKGNGGFYSIQDEINDEWYIVKYSGDKRELLNRDLEHICDFTYTARVCNRIVIEENETYCQAEDLSGNVIFRYIYPAAGVENDG